MLPLTDTERALLTARNVEFTAGLELLDTQGRLVEDISPDLADGSIEYDNQASVHGSCRLSIMRRLQWGRDRVRPYVVVSDGRSSLRINQGVYVLTTPSEERGEDPQTFDVTGYNLLHLLQDGPGDTYVAAAGTSYLQAVRDVLTAAGMTVPLYIDGTLQATALPADRVWALADGGASWLGIIDDLLDEIGYTHLWADRDGSLRSSPYMDPSIRPSEHTFDTSDDGANIVHQDRRTVENVAAAVNHWRFVRDDMDHQPTEGDGIYTVENLADGATSQEALGRVVRKVTNLRAADQASLVAQGNRIVTEDKQVTRTVELDIDPFPALGHADVVTLVDAGLTEKLPVAAWSLSLTGQAGPLTLGGTGGPAFVERREVQAQATVTSAAPLRVVVDGATTDSFANALDAASYQVGARVTVTIRNPLPPLVQGIETAGGA